MRGGFELGCIMWSTSTLANLTKLIYAFQFQFKEKIDRKL